MNVSAFKREMLACAAILIAGALATVALFAFVAVYIHNDSPVHAETRPACDVNVDVVTVWKDDPLPCNPSGAQRIDVVGLDFANDQPWLRCDDMGGDWVGDGVDICQDVDK